VCLRLPAYSASAKDICFIGAQPFSSWDSRISPDLEVFFRVSLSDLPLTATLRVHWLYEEPQVNIG
ncbi:hypothetical protein, partial [Pseudomonas gessardii]|uniref:hypothetical protein n=1 Tax=Pseudomonas gessardii TaxID=78544 RepID=UPI001CA3B2EA